MEFSQHVKSSVNIVGVVGESVRLKKRGADNYAGLCPFHNEKTPSFNVNERLQIYKCFGCGKGGDVFNFVMEMQGLSFPEALEMIAERHGIPIPAIRGGESPDAETRLRAAVYRIHELAQDLFRKQLLGAPGASVRAYLDKRGVSAETQERFGLGFALDSGSSLLKVLEREGVTREHMEASGLILKRNDGNGYFDRFRGRLMFPIHSERGKVVAFAGRALRDDQQAKYLNSSETAIYKKNSVLYNLHRAREAVRRENRVLLVEGYMDVIGVDRSGVSLAVASCGTSLTTQQAHMIRRHAETVIVNFDADQAGQSATERSIEILLEQDLKVRVLTLPEGLDPDEFCARHGGDRYRELLDLSPDYYFWLAERARGKHNTRTAEGRVAAFQELVPAINLLRDKIKRVSLANELAEHLGVESGLVLEHFRRSASERRNEPLVISTDDIFSPGERVLLGLFLESEEARKELLADAVALAREDQLPSHRIMESLDAVVRQGEAFQFAALEGRLESKDRELLSRIVFSHDRYGWSIEDGRQALEALQRQGWQRHYRAVARDIAGAEREGDHAKALELLRKKKDLETLGRRIGGLPQPLAARDA